MIKVVPGVVCEVTFGVSGMRVVGGVVFWERMMTGGRVLGGEYDGE